MAEDRRTEDLSALKEQLRLLDECNQAKEELKTLENEMKEPEGLLSLKEPTSQAARLESEYHDRVRGIDTSINNLKKEIKNIDTEGTAFLGIAFLLSIVLGVVTLGYFIIKQHDFLLGLLAGAGVFIAIMIIGAIGDSKIKKGKINAIDEQIKNYETRKKELAEGLKQDQKEVAASDKALREEYNAKKKAIRENAKAEFQPKIEAKKKEIEELNAKYEAATVIPHSENLRKELKKLIWVITERYADTIPEARRYVKEEADREKAAKEKADKEARERALMLQRMEEERKRNSPGTVVVYATEDGKGKNADVYVDGGYYGAINYALGWTQFSLSPGFHTVSVVIHSQGYHFQSAPESFNLEGGSEISLKFSVLGYNRIFCSRF